jgi:hypothetical protein
MQVMGSIVDGTAAAGATVSYQMFQAKEGMDRIELEFRTRPFTESRRISLSPRT